MAIYKGGTQIRQIYKGSTPISKVYKGSTLIWQRSQPWTIGTGNPYFNTSGLFRNTSVQGGEANISSTYMNVNTSHQAVGGYPLGRIEGSINPQGCNRVRFTVSNVYSYWTNASAIVFAGQTIYLNSSGQYVLTLTPTWTPQSFAFTNQSQTRDSGYGNAQLDKIEFYDT